MKAPSSSHHGFDPYPDHPVDLSKVLQFVASAHLPTRHGLFKVLAFLNHFTHQEHLALVHNRVSGFANVPVRLHSECLTGDVFGSLRCDCREQLEMALEFIPTLPRGIILYLRQEGRGIGLVHKIQAYALQEQGLDTVEANLHLGFDDDLRDYTDAALILQFLKVKSINLMTNNLNKVYGLQEHGIEVQTRTPVLIPPNPHNYNYLKTKKIKSGHLLSHIDLNKALHRS